MPLSFLQALIDAGKIYKDETYTDRYYIYHNQTLTFRFLSGTTKITNAEFMNCGVYDDGLRIRLCLGQNDAIKYKESPTWVLGDSFFTYFCFYFDYQRNEVGLANQVLKLGN